MKTGATSRQVEQAAFKAYINPSLTDEDYGEHAEWAMGEAYRFAESLVPEDARIVALDDLKRIRNGWSWRPPEDGLLQRIDALIAGDQP